MSEKVGRGTDGNFLFFGVFFRIFFLENFGEVREILNSVKMKVFYFILYIFICMDVVGVLFHKDSLP